MEKYYTPKLDELFVGYEYEDKRLLRNNKEKWIKEILPKGISFTYLEYLVKYNLIRTPYLTKEQLINEGWELIAEPFNSWTFKKGLYIIQYLYNVQGLYINIQEEEGLVQIYRGFCKSINEFRKLIKWLKDE